MAYLVIVERLSVIEMETSGTTRRYFTADGCSKQAVFSRGGCSGQQLIKLILKKSVASLQCKDLDI